MLRMTETRGHLLSHHTWDTGPAIATLPPSQCDNSSGMRRGFVPVMWPLSINMFYSVLINTSTRWPASEVCHTTRILSTTFFGIRAIDNYAQFIRHASDYNQPTFSRLLWSEGAELKTSCGVTMQGDNALVIVFLHSWQPRPFLPSSPDQDGDTPLKILMT